MMQGFYMLAMRQYQRRRRIVLLALALTLVCAVFAARAYWRPVPASAPAALPVSYTAVSENNRLVIYRGGDLLLRTEIDIRALPTADQLALAEGVTLPDAESLAGLLEDYGS